MKQKSSSTSSSDWQGFVKTLLLAATASLVLTYVAVYVIDPYDAFVYSPNAERLPASKMPRYWKPGLARKDRFDSFIGGTSAVMLLKPARLNALLDANIANLAIPAATQYEQMRIAALFQQYHSNINLVVVGIDQAWCSIRGAPRFAHVSGDRLEERRPIEEWLYSSTFWSQLPPLNSRIVKDSTKQLKSMLGLHDYGIDRDGYYDFTIEYEEKYSAQLVHKKLYGNRPPTQDVKGSVATATAQQWPFPDIALLSEWMVSLPATTRKILLFPPYHHNHAALRGFKNKARWQECKSRVAAIGATAAETTVIDFMFDSPVTLHDSNYWDPIHYKVAVARKIEEALAEVAMQAPGDSTYAGKKSDSYYRVLAAP